MTAVDNDSTVDVHEDASAHNDGHSIWARLGAEFTGSLLICFAIYMASSFGVVFYGYNLAFLVVATGVVYAAMTAIFARISGAQFNPAVTVAAMLTSKVRVLDGVFMIIAQVLGGLVAGAVFSFMIPSSQTVQKSQWTMMAINGYDVNSLSYSNMSQYGLSYSVTMAIIVELLASVIVVAAAMMTLKKNGHATRSATLTMGVAYAAAAAMALPITGASVNPVRATGIAIFASHDGANAQTVNPLSQLWVFWVTAILAAAIVALVMIIAQLAHSRENNGDEMDVDAAEAAMAQGDEADHNEDGIEATADVTTDQLDPTVDVFSNQHGADYHDAPDAHMTMETTTVTTSVDETDGEVQQR
ncbi:MIP/aquaporin family protein [Bifidobacterium criceti]|uniref:Membrane channel protein n=1 Tax=Bifidobacterium criceti TaxID=1960969 RepID=A0A2A2EBZ6_9BIFI|nr:aquaporin [Bifidobacterium criceti]PAU66899.1 membrane channel protein [Bifidobacterium criceti]